MGRQAPSSGFPYKVLLGFFQILLDLSLRAGVSGTLRGASYTGVAHACSLENYGNVFQWFSFGERGDFGGQLLWPLVILKGRRPSDVPG